MKIVGLRTLGATNVATEEQDLEDLLGCTVRVTMSGSGMVKRTRPAWRREMPSQFEGTDGRIADIVHKMHQAKPEMEMSEISKVVSLSEDLVRGILQAKAHFPLAMNQSLFFFVKDHGAETCTLELLAPGGKLQVLGHCAVGLADLADRGGSGGGSGEVTTGLQTFNLSSAATPKHSHDETPNHNGAHLNGFSPTKANLKVPPSAESSPETTRHRVDSTPASRRSVNSLETSTLSFFSSHHTEGGSGGVRTRRERMQECGFELQAEVQLFPLASSDRFASGVDLTSKGGAGGVDVFGKTIDRSRSFSYP